MRRRVILLREYDVVFVVNALIFVPFHIDLEILYTICLISKAVVQSVRLFCVGGRRVSQLSL